MTMAVNRQRSRQPQPSAPPRHPPALADGVTLLGEYDGSGYTSPHYLARRPTGNVVQLTELLFLVADACDGRRDHEQIAAQVSERYGKRLSADNVETLLGKLRPLGIVTEPDGSTAEVADPDPLLALRWRVSLVGEHAVQRVTGPFRWLFHRPIVAAVAVALFALDGWLFFVHGLGQPMRQTIENPVMFLLVAALVVASAAFHELGHAAACCYSGGRPGRMGAGIYLAWPAFYTDVTDAYRLPRGGRLRTDLGGIYFNAVFVLAMAGLWRVSGFEPLLLVAFLLQVEILQQLLPFLRLDGYYVLSDLAGVPDLFRRIPAVLRSAIPWRPTDPAVHELKRWVRVMVVGWTLVVLPLLLANLVLAVVSAPRIFATAWHAAATLVYGFEHAGALLKAADALQLLFLAVPLLGLVFTFVRIGRRSAGGAWRWSEDSPVRRGLVLTGAAAAVGALAFVWWPDGRVTPYRPGEKGTLTQQVRDVGHRGGSPLLPGPQQAATQPLAPAADGTTRQAQQHATAPAAPAAPATPATPTAAPTASASPAPSAAAASPAASPSAAASPTASPAATATPTAASSPTAPATPTPTATATASTSP